MKKSSKLKKTASALLLATSPAWANSKTADGPAISPNTPPFPQKSPKEAPGGKSQINIASITVDKADKRKLQNCSVPEVKLTKHRPESILSMAFDPKKRQVVTFKFEMGSIPSKSEERVLVLLYSRCLSSQPKIKSPLSKTKLILDVKDIKILGNYTVPAIKNAKKGQEAMQMTIDVELETAKLMKQIQANNDTFYFQAGLLSKTHFKKENYSSTIFSPLTAIHFTPKTCPNKTQFTTRITAENASCQQIPTK